jgi:micrococcal nuclease|tara:strand:+ start:2496 stop:2921 length:426 start_codon:yes stop_codon:yes gene_type:complete
MYNYKATLVKVVDGDTIDADIDLGFKVHMKARVRLMGIDTPESRTRNLKEKTWGLAAKKRVQELLVDGKFILNTELQKKGKFGRILGNVIIPDDFTWEGLNLNEILMEEKLAIPYDGSNKDEARERHGVAELWNTEYKEPE